ncbi:protein MULTIPLE CHLOROPLAST DIVISION SITE 1-like isoform X2 [Rhododendron vialii]|uniref:protein MULTIPLE CHLOROPLAST DIVISION SITE 1-like isoform X2 n=1 Tax=Rhododendron vialii TaxID=182163 RepID=UPI0026604385|nr:protein MULTIPLE CHLOROPLAST DIVISION SITE 1-like isoform X2 [Rhododendron vialii]
METSIRCGGDSKALKIHAKEKLFIDSNTRLQPSICVLKHQVLSNVLELRTDWGFNYGNRKKRCGMFVLRASSNSGSSDDGKHIGEIVVEAKRDKVVDFKNQVARLQATVASLPPVVLVMKRQPGSNFAIVFCILATILFISVRVHMAKKARYSRPGSVADLVRRGQLRSDRRGISTPLKYEDPFNNPLVKVGKSNSTVEMCGKVYRLAPVTLTREQQAIHQKRRSRAYQWKRPTVFLREGDPVPPDVDPDTIRWIPANHPFATTASDIDEDLAQNNVYQKHGVPFRIQAEHEALQRKLEALQSQQQFKKLVIDPGAAKDFERPFRSHPKDGKIEDNQSYNPLAPKPSKLEHGPNSFGSNSTSEESPEI